MEDPSVIIEHFIVHNEILEEIYNFISGMKYLEELESYLHNVQDNHTVRPGLVAPALAKVSRVVCSAMVPSIFTSLTDGFKLLRMVGRVNRELATPFDLRPLIAMLRTAVARNQSRASTSNEGTTTASTTMTPASGRTSTSSQANSSPTPNPTQTTTSSPSNLSNFIEAMVSSLVSPPAEPSSDVVAVIPRYFQDPFSQRSSSEFYSSENTTLVDTIASTSGNMASSNAPSPSETISGTTPTMAPANVASIATSTSTDAPTMAPTTASDTARTTAPDTAATTEKSIPELMAELDDLTERVASKMKFQAEILDDCRDIYARTMAPLNPAEVAECEAEAIRQVQAQGLKTEFHCTILDQTLKEKRTLLEKNEDLEAENADLLARLAAFEQEKDRAREKAARRRANHVAALKAKEENIARLEAKAKAEEDAKAKDGVGAGGEGEGGSAGNDGLLEVTSPSSSGTQAGGCGSSIPEQQTQAKAVEAEVKEDGTGADGSGTSPVASPGKTGKHRFSKSCAVL